jgi:hypothetical protein
MHEMVSLGKPADSVTSELFHTLTRALNRVRTRHIGASTVLDRQLDKALLTELYSVIETHLLFTLYDRLKEGIHEP